MFNEVVQYSVETTLEVY